MEQNKRSFIIPFFLIAILLAVILRTATISHESLWGDEAWTLKFASATPSDLLHQTREDVHPPLYFLFMHYWMEIFGTSEVALRLPSLIFSLISIYLFYRLSKRLNLNPLPITALFALSLSGLVYSQETRSYALIVLLVLWMIHSLIKLRQENKGLLELTIANTLLLYTHVFGLVAVIIAAAILFFSFPRKEVISLPMGIAFLLPFALFSPWLIPFIKQIYLFLPLLLERLALNSEGLITPVVFWICASIGMIITITLILYKLKKDSFSLLDYYQKAITFLQKHVLFLTAAWILFFSLTYHFFAATNPFVRYLLFLLPLIYLTLGKILHHKENLARVFIVFSFILLAINVTTIDRYDWKHATQYALGFNDQNTIYGFELAGSSYRLFEYYAHKQIPNIEQQMVKFRYIEIIKDEEGVNHEKEIRLPTDQINPYKRYVLIISKLDNGESSEYEAILEQTHLKTQSRDFEDIEIVVFEAKN
ncbi:glycosyltransferase family 39 protein [Candidatus Woesearchaeota archaeon]|nr:glycosyltransferase family 39 protein [Candidatus Woesearchaeota archaeon]